jgi:hypothetical protein
MRRSRPVGLRTVSLPLSAPTPACNAVGVVDCLEDFEYFSGDYMKSGTPSERACLASKGLG